MIRPSTRLLYGTALIAMPLALVAAATPGSLPLLGLALAGIALVAALDAWKGSHTLAGINLKNGEPIRLQKGEKGELPLLLTHPEGSRAEIRLMADIPDALGAERDETTLRFPPSGTQSSISLPCKPLQRGHFPITRATLETASPLGLWHISRLSTPEIEARVYPSLTQERKAIAILLSRHSLGSLPRRQSGKGREFDKIRDYQPGDPLQDIHWKATAKRRTPMSKTYQVERTQEVVVILDASRFSMTRNADGVTLLERFISASLVLSLAAAQQGDHFGLLAFNDRIRRFISPRVGKEHFQTCRDLLYALEPAPVSPDFHEVATTLQLRLRKRTLLVFLTSLGDPATADAFQKNIPPLCRQHLMLVNMPRPPLAKPLFSEEIAHTDALYGHLAGHLQWQDLRERQRSLQREGVTLSLFDEEKLCVELVSQYMEMKSRQLL